MFSVFHSPLMFAKRSVLQQAGKADFELLEKKALEWGEPKVPSGKQVRPFLVYGIHNFWL